MTGPFFFSFLFFALGSCSFRGKKPAIALVLPCAWGFLVALQEIYEYHYTFPSQFPAPQGALLRLCPVYLLVASALCHIHPSQRYLKTNGQTAMSHSYTRGIYTLWLPVRMESLMTGLMISCSHNDHMLYVPSLRCASFFLLSAG